MNADISLGKTAFKYLLFQRESYPNFLQLSAGSFQAQEFPVFMLLPKFYHEVQSIKYWQSGHNKYFSCGLTFKCPKSQGFFSTLQEQTCKTGFVFHHLQEHARPISDIAWTRWQNKINLLASAEVVQCLWRVGILFEKSYCPTSVSERGVSNSLWQIITKLYRKKHNSIVQSCYAHNFQCHFIFHWYIETLIAFSVGTFFPALIFH